MAQTNQDGRAFWLSAMRTVNTADPRLRMQPPARAANELACAPVRRCYVKPVESIYKNAVQLTVAARSDDEPAG